MAARQQTTSRFRSTDLVLFFALLLPSSLVAQTATDAAARTALAEQLVAEHESLGREFPADLHAAIVARLSQESLTQLQTRAMSHNIATNALGDQTADLVYTQFAQPCRIIDTRVPGAPLTGGSPGTAQNFVVVGSTGFAAQGGNASGCGIPLGATAAFINFVAVNPLGAGNLRGSAYGTPIPSVGSIINYQALTPTLNIANGVMFPLCIPSVGAVCTDDISLAANGAGTDLVADVLGYARPFDKSQVRSFTVENSTPLNGFSSTCSETAEVTVNAPVAGNVTVFGKSFITVSHTTGVPDIVQLTLAPGSSTCSATAVGLDSDYYTVSPALPTGVYNGYAVVVKTFAVPAGATTIFLSGAHTNGSGGSFPVSVGLSATFMPN